MITTLSFTNKDNHLVTGGYFYMPANLIWDLLQYDHIFYDPFFSHYLFQQANLAVPATKLFYSQDQLSFFAAAQQPRMLVDDLVPVLNTMTDEKVLICTQSSRLIHEVQAATQRVDNLINFHFPDSTADAPQQQSIPKFYDNLDVCIKMPKVIVYRQFKDVVETDEDVSKEEEVQVILPTTSKLKSKSSFVVGITPDLEYFFSFDKLIAIRRKKHVYFLDPEDYFMLPHKKQTARDYKDLLTKYPNATVTSPSRFFRLYRAIQNRIDEKV